MQAAFGQKLAQLRQQAGISQRSAAQALQISQALLSHYEKGIREPRLSFVVRAARYYGVSTDYLLGHESAQFRTPPSEITYEPSSEFAAHIQIQLRDTMDILMDLYNRYFDENIFCYGGIYLAETLYTLIRDLSLAAPDFDCTPFRLDSSVFHTGGVTSDMNWVHSQYIRALQRFLDKNGPQNAPTFAELRQRYGSAFDSASEVLGLVGERVSRQDAAERHISTAMFGVYDRTQRKSTPEEEVNQ